MKAKKIGILVSIVLLLISISLIEIGTVGSNGNSGLLMQSIGVGLLGSTVVTFSISIGEYFVERKRALVNYYVIASRFIDSILQIKYTKITEKERLLLNYYSTFDTNDDLEFITHKKENAYNNVLNYLLEAEKETGVSLLTTMNSEAVKIAVRFFAEDTYKEVLATKNSYLKLKGAELPEFENAFGQLDFLFGNRRCRNKIYDNIQKPIRGVLGTILSNLNCFEPNLDGSQPPLDVIYKALCLLNGILFKEETEETDNDIITTIYLCFYDEIKTQLELLRAKVEKDNPEKIERKIISQTKHKKQ